MLDTFKSSEARLGSDSAMHMVHRDESQYDNSTTHRDESHHDNSTTHLNFFPSLSCSHLLLSTAVTLHLDRFGFKHPEFVETILELRSTDSLNFLFSCKLAFFLQHFGLYAYFHDVSLCLETRDFKHNIFVPFQSCVDGVLQMSLRSFRVLGDK